VRGVDAPIPVTPDSESSSAEEVLEHVVARFHPRLYVACSFQKEASVIMDMILKIEPTTRFFTLDTGFLFDETKATWRGLEEHYGVTVEAAAGMSVGEQARVHGDELWKRDPDACCGIRKVVPLRERLSTVDAWVAGLRREQSESRATTPKLHWDEKHGLWKANPLADWSERDVWNYIAANDVPYNGLHDKGYASIGCTHCTHPSEGRDGRWAGSDKLECGIHG
jgi:phosphoadenosine phosphosulfate reductase